MNNPNTDEKEPSKLQETIVNFVGDYLKEKEEIRVEDIIEVFAKEFPEFLLVVAEENFIRGYQQALLDIELVDGNNERN